MPGLTEFTSINDATAHAKLSPLGPRARRWRQTVQLVRRNRNLRIVATGGETFLWTCSVTFVFDSLFASHDALNKTQRALLSRE